MIATNYNPKASEEKWYKYWMDHKLFHSEVDNSREPYCIVIPPPNVTGVLHMGHMLNNTIQDGFGTPGPSVREKCLVGCLARTTLR